MENTDTGRLSGRSLILTIVFTFTIIYASTSFAMESKPGVVRLSVYTIEVLLLLLYKRQVKIHKLQLLILCAVLITYIWNGEDVKGLLILLISVVTAIIFVSTIKVDDFIVAYVVVISIISAITIFLWAMATLFPGMLEYLPTLVNSQGVSAKSIFFAVHMVKFRAQGFFWEPGAFQLFANLALVLLFFWKKWKWKKRNMIICTGINTLAVMMTLSSTAYIILVLLYSYYVLQIMLSRFSTVNEWKIVMVIEIILALAIIAIFQLPSYITYFIYGKFFAYFGNGTANTISVTTRIDAMEGALNLFLQSPLIGTGLQRSLTFFGDSYGHKNMVCTFLNWFARYGMLVGGVMTYGVYEICKYICKRRGTAAFITLVVIIMTASEDVAMLPAFIIWAFYGLSIFEREKMTDRGVVITW